MATCDLPDLDEFAEEEEQSPNDRRLSLDNFPVFGKDVGSSPGDITHKTIYNETTANDIQSWWNDVIKSN